MIKPALALFAAAAVMTALLGLVHALTLEPIENQLKRTRERIKQEILTGADVFEELVVEPSGSIVRVYEAFNGDGPVGYLLELSPAGYSGQIDLMVGLSSVDGTVAGMRVLKHSETPGLGALAVKESFYRQFDGRKLIPLRVVKGASGEDEIDAITGATVTTQAIAGAVNEAVEWYGGYHPETRPNGGGRD
ncbi:MAG: RnfABCDGE type electron transport complex subunit G [Oscillospiraceae bacterium]|nr:RnfABCDGE type electron transport complex subunit G [Oscillospiraceae bacterium]